MNKLLLTCFLALLCLVGRYLVAQSKVVRSPGAELLHRSDSPNRGGAILPDTFIEYTNGAEISSSPLPSSGPWTVDGGPILRSTVSHLPSHINFGLVDQHLDSGAGEGTFSFHPAPFTVSASQNRPEFARQELESQCLVSNVACAEHSRNIRLDTSPASQSDSLQIGDLIPDDLVFTQVLLTDSKSIRLSDYRGKYLILQFWATWCTASSGYLLQAEEIQDHFGDRIQVLPVTYESKEQVAKSLQQRKSLSTLSLPLVTGETRLRTYFPHISLPHLILIDPEGRLKAITGAEDMNIQNLQALMERGESRFRLKQDSRIPFDMEEKLISGNHQIISKNIQFQSALTHYIPGVSGGSMESLADGTHLLFVNTSLIKLYRQAYSGRDLPNFFGSNRILTEGFEEEELTTTKSGLDYREWMEKGDRVFGYELIAPPGVDGYALMREDLNRYFPHIQAKIEVRPRMVWAFVQQEGRAYPQSNSEKSYQVQPGSALLRNSLLTGFIYQLNLYFMQRSPNPVIDRTGIDYPIDINLEANFSNPESLKAALNKVGLDLVLREEHIPVLILTKTQTQIIP